jgi:hypothetical protein
LQGHGSAVGFATEALNAAIGIDHPRRTIPGPLINGKLRIVRLRAYVHALVATYTPSQVHTYQLAFEALSLDHHFSLTHHQNIV